MKKIISAIILITASWVANAQYFIPVFNNELDKIRNTGTLFTDTVHNYLYLPVRYYTGSHIDSSKVFAFRGNNLFQVGEVQTGSDGGFGRGAVLSNGKCIVSYGYDDVYFYSIEGLNMYDCFNTVCGVGTYLNCVNAFGDTAYVGGSFSNFSGSKGIGGISQSGPFNLGSGITSSPPGSGVNDIEYFNGELYACGDFSSMNNSNSSAIARWNGNDWFPLGGGLTFSGGNSGEPQSIKSYKGKLYVGGNFDFAGGISCNDFARWTGTQWESISIFVGAVYFSDMKVYHNKLYLAGSILAKTTLASYDEVSFKYFKEVGCCVNSLEVFNDTLFIAGNFDSISYIPARKLAKFVDGTFSTYAPVTTKWWYNSSENGQQANNSCYKYYEVARDTFVMNTPPTSGYNCRKIKAEQYLPNKTHTALQPLYVFGDTSRIMYYNNYQKRFVEGYRFNVKVGDTITYYAPEPQFPEEETFRVVVDSITWLTVQTEKLKRIYTTPLDGWSFGNDGYAQLIGGLTSMLPQPINYYSNEGPLSCYQDTSLYFKYFTGGVACDYAVSVVTERGNSKITISPNPNDGKFYIVLNGMDEKENNEIAVFDLLNRNIFAKSVIVASNSVSAIELPSTIAEGIYVLKVRSKQKNNFVKLIIAKP